VPGTALTVASLPTLPAFSGTFLIAGWIRSQSVGQGFTILQDTGAAGLSVSLFVDSSSGMTWGISGKEGDGSSVFSISVPIGISAFNTWTSFAISGDTSSEVLQLMINVGLQTITPTFFSDHPIGYPPSDGWTIGPTNSLGSGIDMSDFRFGAGEGFFDLSNSLNVSKLFVIGGNHPLFWGNNGELPTGASPAVYLTGTFPVYPTNFGTGGTFSTSGPALTEFLPGPI
jgi:hypothetical protein